MSSVADREMAKPTEEDAILAEESSRTLAEFVQHPDGTIAIEVRQGKGQGVVAQRVVIPYAAFRMLYDILTHMAQGTPVAIVPHNAELTTQQAADILNVSRPFLVKLLDDRRIPFTKVGTRRRVKCEDIIRYKRQVEANRLAILDELAEEAQELGLYD